MVLILAKDKDAKVNKILTIYEKPTKGEVIYKKQLATIFGSNKKNNTKG